MRPRGLHLAIFDAIRTTSASPGESRAPFTLERNMGDERVLEDGAVTVAPEDQMFFLVAPIAYVKTLHEVLRLIETHILDARDEQALRLAVRVDRALGDHGLRQRLVESLCKKVGA
jgi:hypothetical protein